MFKRRRAVVAGFGTHLQRQHKLRAATRSVVEALEDRRLMSVVTVNSVADNATNDSEVTLREAIGLINGTFALGDFTADEQLQIDLTEPLGTNDTIRFNIAGSGVHTIALLSELPEIRKTVFIDGYSQAGSSVNTSAAGTNAVLSIELDGTAAGANASGLTFAEESDGSTVRGLVINRFNDAGILTVNTGNITIAGNFIGTNATGTAGSANNRGVALAYTNGSTIGGPTVAERNLISGNVTDGVQVFDDGPNLVLGNYIGTNAAGTAAIANGEHGVEISSGGNFVLANLISGNGGNGVLLTEGERGTSGENTVQSNIIGLDVLGQVLGNGDTGVQTHDEANGNLIGGATAGLGNVISGNRYDGIYLSSNNNVVQGNIIGLDPTGTQARGNGGGVSVFSARDNLIGGTTAGARNVISGNQLDGVHLSIGSTRTTVQGNYIGTDITGLVAVANADAGIDLDRTNDTLVGGAVAGARNIIAGNKADGIEVSASGTGNDRVIIAGNYIGLNAAGAAMGNGRNGVTVTSENTGGVLIGGTVPAAANIIAYNVKAGVAVQSDGYGENTAIRQNSIHSNGGLGIDLQNALSSSSQFEVGVTPNDPLDEDDGANNNQNFPVLISANATATSVTIAGFFNSTPNTPFAIDFYANDTVDPTGLGEGKRYIGTALVMTDSAGNALINSTFNVALGADKYITATATTLLEAPFGDTSEFSLAIEATLPVVPPQPPAKPSVSVNDVKKNEGDSGSTSFTFTLTRTGDLSKSSTVKVSTANGTAGSSDFTAVSNKTVTFAAGQSTATVTVTVKGDKSIEDDETFKLKVTAVTNAVIGDGEGLGTIRNDDVKPPCVVDKDPCDSKKTALIVTGSDASEKIVITYAGKGKAEVWINDKSCGTFSYTGCIVVYAKGGHDLVWIDPKITATAFLFGGDGDDYLYAGGGASVLVGGKGKDALYGGSKRDLCIGGDGEDYLDGGDDEDCLIGGSVSCENTITDLCKVQKEWIRTDKKYADRVKNLRNGAGHCGGVKFSESTISGDNWTDTCKGGGSTDTYFVATTDASGRKKDVLSDKSSSETLVVCTLPQA